jgi:hypothetical protein
MKKLVTLFLILSSCCFAEDFNFSNDLEDRLMIESFLDKDDKPRLRDSESIKIC